MRQSLAMIVGSFWALTGMPGLARATVVSANPSNYRRLLDTLKPGDTLNLAPGTYVRLNIKNLNGIPEAWITITGPATEPAAIIVGEPEYNTVEILNSSYLAIENLRIDSRGIPGAFGISARSPEENLTHHIRIEGNTLVGQNGSQQTDGISTKIPTWGWVIRYNRIIGAGTGIYLGNSDGTQPFVEGIIEHNLIQNTIGYNMEIKDQISLPGIPGMPLAPTTTIIRDNVFIKNDQPSSDGDRPNVLVGSFPVTGAGALNMYEIYGNCFIHNHREALFQGSGRVTLHDNIFVDGPYEYPAVVLRKQNYPLQIAYVYNNTVYTTGRGIYFGSRALVDDAVTGNLVFGLAPISGSIMRQLNNLVESVENAPKYVRAPSFEPGSMDFFPLSGKCQGPPIDLSPFQTDADYSIDFNGTLKTAFKSAAVFRGAYAGEGTNPGWNVQADMKPPRPPASSPAPTLVWISPAGALKGTKIRVTLTGAHFMPGATVTISGSDVKADAVTEDSATQITATLTIAANAEAGARNVTVSSGGAESNALKFQIRQRPAR